MNLNKAKIKLHRGRVHSFIHSLKADLVFKVRTGIDLTLIVIGFALGTKGRKISSVSDFSFASDATFGLPLATSGLPLAASGLPLATSGLQLAAAHGNDASVSPLTAADADFAENFSKIRSILALSSSLIV